MKLNLNYLIIHIIHLNLMNKYKKDNISMIIGQDQLLNLNNWYNYEYIIKNVSIICFRRNFKI